MNRKVAATRLVSLCGLSLGSAYAVLNNAKSKGMARLPGLQVSAQFCWTGYDNNGEWFYDIMLG